VSNEYDFTPLHIAVSTFENATTVRSSTKVLVAIINASPAAVQRKGGDVDKTPLHIALLPRQTVDDAVVLAMIKSCPAAVQVKDSEHGRNTRNTLLRAVIERGRTTIPSEAVMLALIDAWPDAVKMKGGDKGNVDDPPTPLLLAVARDAPDAIVIAMLNRCPASARVKDSLGRTALHYTLSGPTSDAFATAVFNAWPEAALEVATTHNSRGWSKGRFSWHGSPHEAGLQSHQIQRKQGGGGRASDTVLIQIFARFPALAQQKNTRTTTLPFHAAIQSQASVALTVATINAWPGAVASAYHCRGPADWCRWVIPHTRGDQLTTIQLAAGCNVGAGVVALLLPVCGVDCAVADSTGCTVLHQLVAAQVTTAAECSNTNVVCRLLLAAGAVLSAVNANGHTAAQFSRLLLSNTAADHGYSATSASADRVTAHLHNYHLAATLKDAGKFRSRLPRLRKFPHFRDWTTVSHAWCTPSAQLTVLTVLLVGETYKRGLLPRLPMDAWYWILNMIPRHELRLGGCTPKEEADAAAKYTTILSEANGGIWLTKSTTKAAWAL